MAKKGLILLVLLIVVVGVWYTFDLNQYFTFYYIQSQQATWAQALEQNPLQVAVIFFSVYVLVTALSLPGAALMTLAAGALFGVVQGTLIASFASTIGASLAFLLARFVARDWVQNKFSDQLQAINRGVEEEGGFYLFSLRLIPAFPFFLINIVMALTPIRLWSFYWISQLGMLAGTVVYVNAGTQLSQLESLKGILSADLILSFIALGLLPLVAKKVINLIRARRNP
ncbi:TVP38/TMEM64 family protein [Ketobacter nezhaii]|uniref:TVP38/TMEM64 family protein n=1 Tax=Ketobacter sp. MCCC 1A13808 TaxID=2602738 RepID=UPI0026922836|nr:TVP38/TMEM64 family protein [Ketobacter sp. MCCC 1A13808]